MAYRDPTFNANLFTDLLSTYLENQSSEREKYYKAEQARSRPQFKAIGTNIVEIDPMTRQTRVIYEGPRKQAKQDLISVETPEGTFLKEKEVGLKTKPAKKEDVQKITPFTKNVIDIANKNITRLNKLKEPRQNPISGSLLSQEEQEKFYGEPEKAEMAFWKSIRKNSKSYSNEFAKSGVLPVYEPGISTPYVPRVREEKRKHSDGTIGVYNADTKELIRMEQ